MNVSQETLNQMMAATRAIQMSLTRIYPYTRNSPVADQVERAIENGMLLSATLNRVGAVTRPESSRSSEISLEMLGSPANRRYEAALQVAYECILAVDRERYGENIGTDGVSQLIEMELARVQAEICGPEGSGLE